jgi:hypothetical protein
MSTIDTMTPYDRRQYELMLDRLKGFAFGAVGLPKLIEDLRSLADALEKPAPAWKEDFLSEWWTLEQVYAVALDRGELDRLPAESQDLLDGAVAALSRKVVEALRQGALATGPPSPGG